MSVMWQKELSIKCQKWFILKVLTFFILTLTFSPLCLAYTNSENYHIVVASEQELDKAISIAQSLEHRYPAEVYPTPNGWYAITIGHYEKQEAIRIKDEAIAEGIIPKDSWLGTGQKAGQEWGSLAYPLDEYPDHTTYPISPLKEFFRNVLVGVYGFCILFFPTVIAFIQGNPSKWGIFAKNLTFLLLMATVVLLLIAILGMAQQKKRRRTSQYWCL